MLSGYRQLLTLGKWLSQLFSMAVVVGGCGEGRKTWCTQEKGRIADLLDSLRLHALSQ